MWEIAYQHWQDPAWPAIFAADRPFGAVGHSAIRWTTLTNGIPIALIVVRPRRVAAGAATLGGGLEA